MEQENMIVVKTDKPFYDDDEKEIEKLTKIFRGIKTIDSISLLPLKVKSKSKRSKTRNPLKGKLKHIFFDIDSTLTHHGVSSLHNNVRDTFQKFLEQNCSVYFCTGRSSQEVKKLIKQYKTSPYGIAENGGIIINSSLVNQKYGDRTEPDRLITYLSKHNIKYKLDPNQQSRKTEYVLEKDSITKKLLSSAIKKSKAKVEVHESKNTYHISKKCVNKGTAIIYLISEDELALANTNHELIGVGDSDLDVPMFEYCNTSYAVANASKVAKNKADFILKKNAPYAIEELYNKLFKFA